MDKPLYISVDYMTYKNSKAGMLNAQIDLLNSMKRLQRLKQIKDEKFKTKLRLYSLFNSLMSDFDKLEPKLPNVELPKEKKIKIEQAKAEPQEKKIKSPKMDGIESELKAIQDKLKKINA